MRMAYPRRRTLAGAALALALFPALAPAAPAPAAPSDKDNAGNPVEKLRKDLDKTISIKFDKQPLPAALDQLRDKTKINIVLDSNTIQQQMGVTPDQLPPVDVDLKDARVRSVLRAILAPENLSYAPVGDAVIVTTEDMAMYRQLRQRITVDMDKVEFAVALRQIAKATAVNLIVDSRVEKQAATTVTLQLEDVPLETAVRLLAEMAGLKPVRVGNVLFVTSKENANELRQDPDIAQPNPNGARAQELLQQQIQLQLGAQAGLGGAIVGGPAGGIGAPPGLAPAVPPVAGPPGVAPAVPPAAAPPADAPKEEKKSTDDKPADPSK